jgi:hypothetical protein
MQGSRSNVYKGATRSSLVCIDITRNDVTSSKTSVNVSGDTNSITDRTWYFWYDTANNFVKKYESNATAPADYIISLPVGIFLNTVDVGYTSTDQVFNGMGYIGSTVWVDKGVKGLIPNGRNEDGSLKNTELTVDKLMTRTFNTTENVVLALYVNSISKTSFETYTYKENENINYSGSNVWDTCVIGSSTLTNGVISNFQPKLPFRAVDYGDCLLKNDKATIANYSFPSTKKTSLTLGASNTQYTAPATGWYFLQKKATGAQYVYMTNTTSGYTVSLNLTNNQTCYLNLPCKKSETVKISYDAGGTTEIFRFHYAEGGV